MEFQNGKLLIATPELMDPNFFRTVSLVFHHDETGAGGVILNRPSNVTIGDVWSELSELPTKTLAARPIYIGGPVDGLLMGLHEPKFSNQDQVVPGVALSLSQTTLGKLLNQHYKSKDTQTIKIFSGYAGWGPNQLEREIEMGGWLTLDCCATDIFETPEEIWRSACEKVGNRIMFDKNLINQSNQTDPLAN